MFRALHRYVVKRKFQKLVQAFDEKIEAARKAHQPTRELERAKRQFVHEALAGRGKA
jgi:hypothetical protein